MEPRAVDLQAQLEGMRRDMDVIRQNVKTIKHRLAYLAGGAVVVFGVLAWIADSRFEQIVALLAR
jgi:hypothetical protein